MLIPPVNFALVVGEVYRSGHPIDLNYEFLSTLELKTIVYVGDGAPAHVAADYAAWAARRGIRLVRLPLASVKEPFVETDPQLVSAALQLIVDRRNHPILVHSDKGKHRVGVIMASVRKCFQHWALALIYEEYIRFAKGKADADFLFIEKFVPRIDAAAPTEYPRWVVAPPEAAQNRI